jgi:hypothetical protein
MDSTYLCWEQLAGMRFLEFQEQGSEYAVGSTLIRGWIGTLRVVTLSSPPRARIQSDDWLSHVPTTELLKRWSFPFASPKLGV